MDSMRSLNSSLPTSTPLSSKHQSHDQLLKAFKSAALSVTNLYKSAASSQAGARQQGYQDALEDLLLFLDKENLGLMDGEGWKVRQWATERFSRGVVGGNGSDSEEDNNNADEEPRARSLSPTERQTQTQLAPLRTASPARKEISQTETTTITRDDHVHQQQLASNPPMFTFSAAPPAGLSLDFDMSAAQSSDSTDDSTAPVHLSEAPTRLDTHSRVSRTVQRHGVRDRNSHRSGTREVRLSAATKRKLPVPDFFNLSNFDNGNTRDQFGGAGNKRGRFV